MKQKIISFFLLFFLFSVACLPLLANAAATAPASEDSITGNLIATKNVAGLPSGELTSVVGNIIKVFVGILIIILTIYLLWAGYTWMTAAGEPDKVKKAKEMIRNGIIGVLIVLISYSISLFVITKITGATG